jgi:hypothetical protein
MRVSTLQHSLSSILTSLANLFIVFRMKGSNHAFLPLASLPVPKFYSQGQVYLWCLEVSRVLGLHSAAAQKVVEIHHDVGSDRIAISCHIHGRRARGIITCRSCWEDLASYCRDLQTIRDSSSARATPSTTLARLHMLKETLNPGTSSHMPRLPKWQN